jgi:iron complex outermembrane receptor protein
MSVEKDGDFRHDAPLGQRAHWGEIMRKVFFWASASAAALAWCGQADAQAAQSTQAQANNSPADQTGSIVITARRRSENLMRTPISATVLTGTDLANKGVTTVDALQFAAPSITVNNFGQGNDFNVRGIGKGEHNTQTTTGVITYRDGAPTFPGYVTEEPYYDIANVQILRGPQGTIVGQNATGGAVFVNSNDASPTGGYHGYLAANYGNYHDLGAQGAVNIPMSSTFAARLAFFGERRDSFYHITGAGGAAYPYNKGDLRMYAGRLSLTWKPSSQLTVTSKTDVDYLDMGAYPADPYTDRFQYFPGTSTPNPGYTDLFDIGANTPQQGRDKFVREILRIDYQFDGGIRFRSVSAWAKANTKYEGDLDGTASGSQHFIDNVDERQISQEFNLISPDTKRFTWLLGAFGVWNDYTFLAPYKFVIDLAYPFNLPQFQYKLQGTNPERSLAVFGQLGFAITPELKAELGGRYTWSRTTNHVDVLQYGAYILDEQAAQFHNFSYKASLDWTLDPHNFLYGFVATGFRPGGLNVPVGIGQPAPFDSEKVQSFEAGWKGTFAGGHVRTTIDGFYNNYKNFQVTVGYPLFPTFGFELNVPGTTKIYGVEAEIEARLGKLSLDAGVNALHSELAQFYAVDTRVPTAVACNPMTGPSSATCINLKGKEQTYAPNFTFNASASYDIDLGRGDTLTPRVSYGHVGAQWATLFENPVLGDRLNERNIVNAQLAWQHQSWTVTAYATNLTNQHYVAALNSGLDFAGAPRQYGIKVQKVF